ncbi:MAG: class I SAM-dependent methyltransferase [Candidatus Marinimicrobia bacterium]|nr:class I SAM-dependent methyltransferase [Candidatus Neomarinimicrobiota bacterium]
MEANIRAQNHFYDGWIYRSFIDPSLAGIRRRVAALVPNGSKVIDIGCGTGDQLFYLAGQISAGLGIELSNSMIKTAEQQGRLGNYKNCEFQLADATNLSHLEDQSFDYAMSSMVIHEMPEPSRLPVLKEMTRLGKQIILVDWINPQPSFWKNAGTHFVERMAGKNHYSGFRSFMKTGGMQALIEKLALEIVETQITSKGTIQLWLCQSPAET